MKSDIYLDKKIFTGKNISKTYDEYGRLIRYTKSETTWRGDQFVHKWGNYDASGQLLESAEFTSKSWTHYDERGRIKSKTIYEDDRGCYLTTACVDYMGLPDNCLELETLRGLRNQMEGSREGRKLIQEYYKKAPNLVERVKSHPQSEQLFSWSYVQIKHATDLTIQGRYDEAVAHYKQTMFKLESSTK